MRQEKKAVSELWHNHFKRNGRKKGKHCRSNEQKECNRFGIDSNYPLTRFNRCMNMKMRRTETQRTK